MKLAELGTFEAAHHNLAWPWIAIDPTRRRFAFVDARGQVETRVLAPSGNHLETGPSFTLPADLHLPTTPALPIGHHGTPTGIHGLAIDPGGDWLTVTGMVDGTSVVVTMGAAGEQKRSSLSALGGPDFIAHAITFDRSGTRIWISAENGEETALVLVDAMTHEVLGVVRSAPFPAPSFHELHVHPQHDAVLLLAACGQDGTFARVAGFANGPPEAVATALDTGSVPCGFVGFSTDGARVHLVEADELRTHAWPGLQELSSVELADDFVSSYAGVVLGHRILLDGHDSETGDFDSVMVFDRAAIHGAIAKDPVPSGMWVGRLGSDAIVTVSAAGEPARGAVVRIEAPAN